VAQLASDLFLYSNAQALQGPLPLLQQSSAFRQPQQQLGIFSSPLHREQPKDLAWVRFTWIYCMGKREMTQAISSLSKKAAAKEEKRTWI